MSAIADLLNIPSWGAGALCVKIGHPDDWFPRRGGSTRAIRAVCRQCPVRPACLDFALRHSIQHGVWGGLSERDRRRLLREERVAS